MSLSRTIRRRKPARPFVRPKTAKPSREKLQSWMDHYLQTVFGDGGDLFDLTTRRRWISTVCEWGRAEPYGWELATYGMDQDDRANDYSPEPPEDACLS